MKDPIQGPPPPICEPVPAQAFARIHTTPPDKSIVRKSLRTIRSPYLFAGDRLPSNDVSIEITRLDNNRGDSYELVVNRLFQVRQKRLFRRAEVHQRWGKPECHLREFWDKALGNHDPSTPPIARGHPREFTVWHLMPKELDELSSLKGAQERANVQKRWSTTIKTLEKQTPGEVLFAYNPCTNSSTISTSKDRSVFRCGCNSQKPPPFPKTTQVGSPVVLSDQDPPVDLPPIVIDPEISEKEGLIVTSEMDSEKNPTSPAPSGPQPTFPPPSGWFPRGKDATGPCHSVGLFGAPRYGLIALLRHLRPTLFIDVRKNAPVKF